MWVVMFVASVLILDVVRTLFYFLKKIIDWSSEAAFWFHMVNWSKSALENITGVH